MDFTHIRTACQFQGCHVQDFLPFHCSSCDKSFCMDHRSPVAHQCSNSKKEGKKLHATVVSCPVCKRGVTVPSGVDPNIIIDQHLGSGCTYGVAESHAASCGLASCQTRTPVPIVCGACGAGFCVAHRDPEVHGCRRGGTGAAATAAKGKRKAGRAKKKKAATSAGNVVVAPFRNARNEAYGPGDIPFQERFYLDVYFYVSGWKALPVKVYARKDWKMGKLLDFICDKLDLNNANNASPSEGRLRFYSVMSHRELGLSETIESLKEARELQGAGSALLIARGSKVPGDVYESIAGHRSGKGCRMM